MAAASCSTRATRLRLALTAMMRLRLSETARPVQNATEFQRRVSAASGLVDASVPRSNNSARERDVPIPASGRPAATSSSRHQLPSICTVSVMRAAVRSACAAHSMSSVGAGRSGVVMHPRTSRTAARFHLIFLP
ncbi:Uncharacterised protein [Mycobacteroides abscessus subsp. abscessus]|nr:Uncharacterised protein [Mycobacteroides abscessus subsp. abscessus]